MQAVDDRRLPHSAKSLYHKLPTTPLPCLRVPGIRGRNISARASAGATWVTTCWTCQSSQCNVEMQNHISVTPSPAVAEVSMYMYYTHVSVPGLEAGLYKSLMWSVIHLQPLQRQEDPSSRVVPQTWMKGTSTNIHRRAA